MSAVAETLGALAGVLDGRRLRWFVFGAQAVAVRGAPRATQDVDVDLVLAGSGLEALALDRATRVEIAGVPVPIAHATDLAVMKALAGRGKDLDDLRSLLAAGGMDRDEARELLAQFERALGRSDLLPRLEAAINEVEGD